MFLTLVDTYNFSIKFKQLLKLDHYHTPSEKPTPPPPHCIDIHLNIFLFFGIIQVNDETELCSQKILLKDSTPVDSKLSEDRPKNQPLVPTKRLHVSGIRGQLTEKKLSSAFSRFGRIEKVKRRSYSMLTLKLIPTCFVQITMDERHGNAIVHFKDWYSAHKCARNDICTISGYRIRLKLEYKTQSQIAHERKLERFMLGLIMSVIFSALLSRILFNTFAI